MLVLENPQTCIENAKHLQIKIVQKIWTQGIVISSNISKRGQLPYIGADLMTAGPDFSLPSLPLLFPSLHSLLPFFPSLLPFRAPASPTPPSCLFLPLPSSLPLPLIQLGGLEEHCKLPQLVRAQPDRQTLWYIFRLKAAHLLFAAVKLSHTPCALLP